MMKTTKVARHLKALVLGWIDSVLSSGGRDLGSPAAPFGTIYADAVTADEVLGQLTGAEWEHSGDMTVDANSASDTVVYIANQGAGRVDLDVDRDIVLGGTVDGVDVAAHAARHASGGADAIDHDGLAGFVANEHVNHGSVAIQAGGILSGGGDLTTSRTISLAHGDVEHDQTAGFVANEHIDHSSVSVVAGAGLTGGGTIAASRTVAVGAGTGITVNANDVAVDTGAALTWTAVQAYNLGANFYSDVFVEANVEISAGDLNIDGSIIVSGTVDGVDVSAHVARHATGGVDDLSIYDMRWSGEATFDNIVVLGFEVELHESMYMLSGAKVGTGNFSSGFAGSGMRLDYGVTESGKTSLTLDNLTVRGRMSVYELLIRQIRATNGSVFVSSTGKVETATNTSGSTYSITSENDHGFAVNDLIRAQRISADGTEIYQSNLRVTAVASTSAFTAVLESGDAPAAGMEFVRLGNTTDANRQGAVYLTADDDNAPFIDIVDGVAAFSEWNTAGKVKARLGQLNGVTYDGDILDGYGLYAENAYLIGSLLAGAGAVKINDLGIQIEATSSIYINNRIEWVDSGGTEVSYLGVAHDGTFTNAGAYVDGAANGTYEIRVTGTNSAVVKIMADHSGVGYIGDGTTQGASIKLSDDGADEEITVKADWLFLESDFDFEVSSRYFKIDAWVTLDEQTFSPVAPTSGTEMRMYMKSDKFVLAYNDSGTTRYKYLNLAGTSASWIHSTTAP